MREMSARKPAEANRVADEDLSPGIRGLLMNLRIDLEPYGWSVHAERSGKHVSFEFRNPLSPLWSGCVFDPTRPISEIRNDLAVHVGEQPEFARTRLAVGPR